LIRYKNPQTPRGVILGGKKLADEFVQIRLGGDQALFQAIGKHLLEAEDREGGVLDHQFIEAHTTGFSGYAAEVAGVPWRELVAATGVPEKALRRVAERVRTSKATIVCWAMGLTQHKHAVATLRDVVNVLLLQGSIGRPGAGVCPVRGHSNVQGDRTMGIYEKPSEHFLAALDREFAFTAPRAHGHDTVEAIRAMRDGSARVFMAMGGNFVSATPDTKVVEAALGNVELTVQVSTKLNRSHVVTGKRAIILPTLGRTDRDVRGGGEQRVTVEDSMSAVHASRGRLVPPADDMLSEVAIIARLCAQLFGTDAGSRFEPQIEGETAAEVDFGQPEHDGIPSDAPAVEHTLLGRPEHGARPSSVPHADWAALEGDYALIRRHIAAVIPGFDDFESRIEKGRTLFLPNGPRDGRNFATATGKALFTANPLEYPFIPHGRLLLQTLRSHDQYNTTIYGKDDRYRGIHGGRRVIMVNPKDIQKLGFAENDIVDVVSEWRDGVERRAEEFRIVAYSTPRGNAAAYYPETNVLVPLDSVADVSGTPTSKSVIVRLERRTT
ncbi:MAG TPA: molybdopterin dinucleotide binding domain-containing protein, partial [Microbacterium sp.]|nr:molybdopterin dinucleotide binding domain-containing protein [Microbacterium sp.]